MERFFRWGLTFLLLLATTMECAQVLLRHIFHMPVIWLGETILFPAIWMYMLGCANASREDTQIVAKILPVLFPSPRSVAVFDFCSRCFSVLISSWLTWYAGEYFFYSIAVNRKTGSLFLPFCIGESAIAFSMLLVTGYSLVYLLRSVRKLRQVFGGEGRTCRASLP